MNARLAATTVIPKHRVLTQLERTAVPATMAGVEQGQHVLVGYLHLVYYRYDGIRSSKSENVKNTSIVFYFN